MTVSGNDAESLAGYEVVVYSFGLGLYRLWSAEAAAARLYCALLSFRSAGADPPDWEGHPYRDALENLAKIPYSSYDAAGYVTNVSHLVYATTLFDTFLTETTLFLFLLHPKSIGQNQQVTLQTVITSSSLNGLITQAAIKRTRELSYLSFQARLHFLGESFGLRFKLDANTIEAVKRYTLLRNSSVHDQGVFDIRLDEVGKIVWQQKACTLHPTPVSGEDVQRAIEVYNEVFQIVANEVFARVLKRLPHPAVSGFLQRRGSRDSGG